MWQKGEVDCVVSTCLASTSKEPSFGSFAPSCTLLFLEMEALPVREMISPLSRGMVPFLILPVSGLLSTILPGDWLVASLRAFSASFTS